MSKSAPLVALCSAVALPSTPGAPDWVHIVPMPGPIHTIKGDGPYRVADAQAVIAASMADPRGIPVDENHATQLRGARGEPAPARGWVTQMEARADGIWARVDWNAAGEALMTDRAYRGLSPVILHQPNGVILAIRTLALTNTPNMIGLTTLNTEFPMNWAKIAVALGLSEDADEAAILAAINKIAGAGSAEAMQTSLNTIATSLGLTSRDPAVIEAAAQMAGSLRVTVESLQSEVAGLKAAGATSASRAFVEGEIAKGRLIPANLVDSLISMHSSDASAAEKWVEAFKTGPAPRAASPAAAGGVLTSLNSEQARAADLMQIPRDKYLATLQAEQAQKESF